MPFYSRVVFAVLSLYKTEVVTACGWSHQMIENHISFTFSFHKPKGHLLFLFFRSDLTQQPSLAHRISSFVWLGVRRLQHMCTCVKSKALACSWSMCIILDYIDGFSGAARHCAACCDARHSTWC